MKIIDLLNKIANGEAPKTILYENETYWYDGRENNYYTYIARDLDDEDIEYLFYGDNTLDMLNDEVEIIEEDKKIKRIQSCGDNLYSEYTGQYLVNKENYTEYDELLMNKINEIIDYLEENK